MNAEEDFAKKRKHMSARRRRDDLGARLTVL